MAAIALVTRIIFHLWLAGMVTQSAMAAGGDAALPLTILFLIATAYWLWIAWKEA